MSFRALLIVLLVAGMVSVLGLVWYFAGSTSPAGGQRQSDDRPVEEGTRSGGDEAGKSRDERASPREELKRIKAHERALEWLLSIQKEDGRWCVGDKLNDEADVMATGLVCLAIIDTTFAHRHPRFRDAVRRALMWLEGPDPLSTKDISPEMALALGSLGSMAPPNKWSRQDVDRLKRLLALGARQAVDAQRPDGGWAQTESAKTSSVCRTCEWALAVRVLCAAQRNLVNRRDPGHQDGVGWDVPRKTTDGVQQWLTRHLDEELREQAGATKQSSAVMDRRSPMLAGALAALNDGAGGKVRRILSEGLPKRDEGKANAAIRVAPEDYDLYGFFLRAEVIEQHADLEQLAEAYGILSDSVASSVTPDGFWEPPKALPPDFEGLRSRGAAGQTALAVLIINTYRGLLGRQIEAAHVDSVLLNGSSTTAGPKE